MVLVTPPSNGIHLMLRLCLCCRLVALAHDPHPQIAACPEGTEAASLDIAKAYCNSPILPNHKKYLPVYWRDRVYVQHVAIEGLATAGGIQGTVADACLQILEYHGIKPVVKWVDDFVLFRELLPKLTPNSTTSFPYNLADILSITHPLSIPWHDVFKKGQDFASSFNYISFTWDIKQRTVHVPLEKWIRAINKIQYALSSLTLTRHDTTSTHGYPPAPHLHLL